MTKVTPIRTAQDIQDELADLDNQIMAMLARRDTLEVQIAENWTGDTQKQETEHVLLISRIAASEKRKGLLQEQWKQAFCAEQTARIKKECLIAVQHRESIKPLLIKAEQLEREAQQLRVQANEHQQNFDSFATKLPYWVKDIQNAGIDDITPILELVNKHRIPGHLSHLEGGWARG